MGYHLLSNKYNDPDKVTSMKALKFIKNAAGISMVEVMMAASVMGGISLTVAQLMKNTSESTKQNEAKQGNVNLKGLLQDYLNNTTACTNTFGTIMTPANVTALSGSSTASVTVNNVKDKTAAIKFSMPTAPSTVINLDPLTITSMTLTNYNSTAFTGDFLVNATFKKSTNNIVMVKPIRIPINFSFNGTTLTACSTMAVGGEWMLGGNAGTVDGTDYVGTSDNTPLNFRVNAQKAGRITTNTNGTTFFGYQAGNAITTGSQNTAIGSRALYSATSAQSNTSIGPDSLGLLTTGNHNTAIGNTAAYTNTTGTANTAIGSSALRYLETGSNNVGLGWAALYGVKTGSNNIGIGQNTLNFISDGSDNVGIGQFAINGNIGPAVVPSGNQNVGVGSFALQNNNGGSFNAALGYRAGSYNSSGHYNTFLGFQTGSWAANLYGSNNVFIGARAGNTVPGAATSSNKLYIETTNNSTPLIGGDFSARQVLINNKLGVGVSAMTSGVTLESYGSGAYIRGIPMNGLGVAISANFGNIVSPPPFTAATGYEILKLGGNLRIAGVFNASRSQQIVFGNATVTEGKIRWYEDAKYWEVSTPTSPSALVISDAGEVAFGGWPDGVNMNRMSFFPATGTAYKELGGSWTAISDGRLKKNIKTLDGALHKISKLRPVSYGWKNEHLHSIPNGDIGFIAQEVEKVFPGWVGETETKSDDRLLLPKGAKVKNVTLPIGFDAYLVKAIQELHEQVIKNQEMFQVMHDGLEEQVKANTNAIVALEEEVKDLKLENKQLRDRLKRIEKALNIK